MKSVLIRLSRYKMKYHQFYSVVPPFLFEAENLAASSVHEPYLLAAVCTLEMLKSPIFHASGVGTQTKRRVGSCYGATK